MQVLQLNMALINGKRQPPLTCAHHCGLTFADEEGGWITRGGGGGVVRRLLIRAEMACIRIAVCLP